MASEQNSPIHLTAGEDFDYPFLRVKADGRTGYIANAADYGIGTNQEDYDDGDEMTVRGYSQGTCKMVASGAISAGDKVYAAASGKIAATGSLTMGTALDTATGNNSVIEVLPHCGLNQSSSSSSSSSSSAS